MDRKQRDELSVWFVLVALVPEAQRHLPAAARSSTGVMDGQTSGPCNFIVPGICMICIIKDPVLPDLSPALL